VAAQALEQSVLESKDKEQLLAIAKALGLKASARTKKADIIGQILETTGPAAPPPAASRAESASTTRSGDGVTNGATNGSSAPTDGSSAPIESSSAPIEPIDEPPAEWEIAAGAASVGSTGTAGITGTATSDTARTSPAANGDDTESAPTTTDGDGDRQQRANRPRADRQHGDQARSDRPQREQPRGDQARGDQARGDRQQGRQGGDRQQGGQGGQGGQNDRQQGGQGGQNDRQQGGQNQGGQQRSMQSSDDGDENRNKRRRRRRKGGRGGDIGPQGDDRELLEAGEISEPVSNEPVEVSGYLDLRDEGYGFLRVKGFLPDREDSYVPVKLSRQYGLRKGDHVTGLSRPAGRNEKNPALLEIYTVNGGTPESAKKRPRFEDLTALFPDHRLRLENDVDPTDMTARIIDLVSPIGKGQRGIIVSPPKAGKTTVMKTIATAIERNNPDVKLMVLLIDERPEEVTDMRRTVKGEVVSSTFDRPSEEHTLVAEMTIERAKRLVEQGEDVVIILDGITRLSRAYNLAAPASGRILSGGIDAGALYPPKKFFGAARNVEEGGSLTILATALVETNSRMDDAIFEEFKGTGNMELRLDRKLSERRIYPAIDVDASSTRHEELLFDRKQLQMVWKLRRVLSGLAADGNAAPGLELLIDRLKTFRTNDEFLNEIAKQPSM
jgi:transcription termination factor Rho